MSIFENNKKHNDKFLKEIWNRIMMKFLSIIPTGLALVQYLTMQGSTPGPLFLLPSKKALTRAYFSKFFTKHSRAPHHLIHTVFELVLPQLLKRQESVIHI